MVKQPSIGTSLIRSVSIAGSKLRCIRDYNHNNMLTNTKNNGKEGENKNKVELERDITVMYHDNETAIYIGPNSGSVTTIQVRAEVGTGSEGRELKEDLIMRTSMCEDKGKMVKTTSITIARTRTKAKGEEEAKSKAAAGTKTEDPDTTSSPRSEAATKNPGNLESEDSSPNRGNGPRKLTTYRDNLPARKADKDMSLSDVSSDEINIQENDPEPTKKKAKVDPEKVMSDTEPETEKPPAAASSDSEGAGPAPTSEADVILQLSSSERREFYMEYDDYEEGEVRDDEEEDQGGHKDPGQSSKY